MSVIKIARIEAGGRKEEGEEERGAPKVLVPLSGEVKEEERGEEVYKEVVAPVAGGVVRAGWRELRVGHPLSPVLQAQSQQAPQPQEQSEKRVECPPGYVVGRKSGRCVPIQPPPGTCPPGMTWVAWEEECISLCPPGRVWVTGRGCVEEPAVEMPSQAPQPPAQQYAQQPGVQQRPAPQPQPSAQPQQQEQRPSGAGQAQQQVQGAVQLSVSVDKGEYGSGEPVTVVVRNATPGDTVEVAVYGPRGELVFAVRGVADQSGVFRFVSSRQLDPGSYRVVARQGGASGEAVFRVVQQEARQQPPPQPAQAPHMIKCPADRLGNVGELKIYWDGEFYRVVCSYEKYGYLGYTEPVLCYKTYGPCQKREIPRNLRYDPKDNNWKWDGCFVNWHCETGTNLDEVAKKYNISVWDQVMCTGCYP